MSIRRSVIVAGVAHLNIAVALVAPLGESEERRGSTGRSAESCHAAVLADDQPVREAVRGRPALAEAVRDQLSTLDDASSAGPSAEESLHRADPALRMDTCGRLYFREAARVSDGDPQPAPTTRRARNLDVLALSSRPGAARTIFLDVDGAVVEGSVWNQQTGQSRIEAAPYSRDHRADVAFDAAEREEIYRLWKTVAEDFAPFDVDVTTTDPGIEALRRTSAADERFGMHVVVTAGGAIQRDCNCGGEAYIDIFDRVDPGATQHPVWVFTDGTGTDGWAMGDTASHEIGHSLGLLHDGTVHPHAEYYAGSGSWAPIMGAPEDKAVTQWSRGEYAEASNTQDDLAVIESNGLPRIADDHGDDAQTATRIPDEVGEVRGTIGIGGDRDAFTIHGDGAMEIDVRPAPGGAANLDVKLQILDARGRQIASVAPRSTSDGAAHPTPLWMGATWRGQLPGSGAEVTAVVSGSGDGDPSRPGGWSSYGSLGTYDIRVVGHGDHGVIVPDQKVHGATYERFTRRLAAEHASGEVEWTAETALPSGVTLTDDGRLTGRADAPEEFTFEVRARDARSSSVGRVTLAVEQEVVIYTHPVLRSARRGQHLHREVRFTGPPGLKVRAERKRLPQGLRLKAGHRSVVLVGTPRTAGVGTFVLRASTPGGQVVRRAYRLRVVGR